MLVCGGGSVAVVGFRFSVDGFCGVGGRRRAGLFPRPVSAVEEGLGLRERSVKLAEP